MRGGQHLLLPGGSTKTKEKIMDKNQTTAAIEVMKAFLEGKKIECRTRGKDRWYSVGAMDMPLWNWENVEYRVAVTPSMLYVIRNADGCVMEACNTPQYAQHRLESYNKCGLYKSYTMETYKQVLE
jgi:hypothetical protein